MCLAQGPQRSDAGEARPLGLESSTEPLPSHLTLVIMFIEFYKRVDKT